MSANTCCNNKILDIPRLERKSIHPNLSFWHAEFLDMYDNDGVLPGDL
jgi:hypothetical protein